MNGRLFALDRESCSPERPLVTMVAIAVRDRGVCADPRARYEAELAGYAVVHGVGASPWEAVCALLATHRVLLERHWWPQGLVP